MHHLGESNEVQSIRLTLMQAHQTGRPKLGLGGLIYQISCDTLLITLYCRVPLIFRMWIGSDRDRDRDPL